jgi:hypothetical protein
MATLLNLVGVYVLVALISLGAIIAAPDRPSDKAAIAAAVLWPIILPIWLGVQIGNRMK